MGVDRGRHRRWLVVARHAKSSWDDPTVADDDRTLAPRGRKAVHRLRHHVAGLAPRPDLVLCSSSRRTRDTLEGIRPALRRETQVEIDRQLYGASAEHLLARLQCIDDKVTCVLLIGHNPAVADLIDLLVTRENRAGSQPAIDRFPTAAVAVLSFAGRWRALRPHIALLDSFWTPRTPS
jgi:phosphohistidine phosphatase